MTFFLDLLFSALTELFAGVVSIAVTLVTEWLATLIAP